MLADGARQIPQPVWTCCESGCGDQPIPTDFTDSASRCVPSLGPTQLPGVYRLWGPPSFPVCTVSGAHPVSYSRVRGIISPGVKRPWREIDHSPYSTEIRNKWSYASAVHVCASHRGRDSFAFFMHGLHAYMFRRFITYPCVRNSLHARARTHAHTHTHRRIQKEGNTLHTFKDDVNIETTMT
jgi:hypothetical protein